MFLSSSADSGDRSTVDQSTPAASASSERALDVVERANRVERHNRKVELGRGVELFERPVEPLVGFHPLHCELRVGDGLRERERLLACLREFLVEIRLRERDHFGLCQP